MVELDPATPAAEIPQLWDELRRKVLNVQPRLPAGASAVTVADDFGDVYGIYYGLSVDGGFTWSELRDWAQRLKTALVTVDGVQKVALYGEQTPVVNVYVSMATLANFAIRPETIVATIGQQNSIVDSGEKQAGKLQIQILEDGTYKTLDDLSDQLLISSSGKQYRLGDIARVERGYAEPPQTMMRVDGRRAVGIGVSTEEGVDVVKTGAEIESPAGFAHAADAAGHGADGALSREPHRPGGQFHVHSQPRRVGCDRHSDHHARHGLPRRGADRQFAALFDRRHAAPDAVSGRGAEPHLAGRFHHRDGHARRQRHRRHRQCTTGHAAGRGTP